MSVDYSANFGVGQQVKYPSDEDIKKHDNTCDDWFDYVNKITKDTKFNYFQFGSAYDEDEMKMCIVFDDKHTKTLDLRPLKNEFLDFIGNTIFETIGDFGIVGGLEES